MSDTGELTDEDWGRLMAEERAEQKTHCVVCDKPTEGLFQLEDQAIVLKMVSRAFCGADCQTAWNKQGKPKMRRLVEGLLIAAHTSTDVSNTRGQIFAGVLSKASDDHRHKMHTLGWRRMEFEDCWAFVI